MQPAQLASMGKSITSMEGGCQLYLTGMTWDSAAQRVGSQINATWYRCHHPLLRLASQRFVQSNDVWIKKCDALKYSWSSITYIGMHLLACMPVQSVTSTSGFEIAWFMSWFMSGCWTTIDLHHVVINDTLIDMQVDGICICCRRVLLCLGDCLL